MAKHSGWRSRCCQCGLALATCPRRTMASRDFSMARGRCVAKGSCPVDEIRMANGLARIKAMACPWSSTRKCSGMYKSAPRCNSWNYKGHEGSQRKTSFEVVFSFRPWLMNLFLAYVQHLLYFCDHGSLLVFHLDLEYGLVLGQAGELLPDIVDQGIAQPELGSHHAFSWLAVAD